MIRIPSSVLLLLLVLLASTLAAQGPQPSGGGMPDLPAPTNLKVLPKNISSGQLRATMMDWAGALGGRCMSCHVIDPVKKEPNGRAVMNFSDDSRPEIAATRRMVLLTEMINKNSNAKPGTVDCGTCHRGMFTPELFKPAAPASAK